MSFHPQPYSPRVLVVEDSLVNRKVLSGLLQRRGCSVTIAENGADSLNRFSEQTFDVIFMDVQMPVMDGLTATRQIRQLEASTTRHTPIIAVTAGIDRKSCLAAGMDDYLLKPLLSETLYEKLYQALATRNI